MGIVWVLEEADLSHAFAAQTLMGNYPVRTIASTNSLCQILKLGTSRSLAPHAVIINLLEESYNLGWLENLLSSHFSDVVRIYLRADTRSPSKPNISILCRNIDRLDLVRYVKKLLKKPKKSSELTTFRDIEYDAEKFSATILSEQRTISLPRKEAQILKLLLESGGKCCTRDQIRERVWGDLAVSGRTIDSHISRLRRRLESSETTIACVYGGGYELR